MYARVIAGVVSIALMGCATAPKSGKPERSFTATGLTVDSASNDREVLGSVPAESIMERFETTDPQGRKVSYVAFTDTDTGALVFVDQKLYSTLSHRDAQAFYSCRGYATSAANHWAHEATDWVASLLANSNPATTVKLEFSGKSTTQSLMEAAENPFIKKLKSLFGMGTKPLGILSSLNTTRNDMEVSNQFDKVLKGLSLIRPGASEFSVAEVMKPEDVLFINGGMVMAYPNYLIEYYVAGGVVKVIQQPSFYYLTRARNALFYAPDIQWPRCTPLNWKEALPEKPAPQPDKPNQ